MSCVFDDNRSEEKKSNILSSEPVTLINPINDKDLGLNRGDYEERMLCNQVKRLEKFCSLLGKDQARRNSIEN